MRARLLAAVALFAAIPLSASIRGTAMSRSGQPIAGAKVSAFALETGASRLERLASKTPLRTALTTTTTSANGAFSLDSPKEPVVELQVEAAGYAPAAIRVLNNDDGVVAALVAAANKQGTVTTAGGKPVSGAVVVVSNGAAEVSATTDGAGHYSIPDPTWATSVDVLHPDFAPFQRMMMPLQKASLDVTLDAGVPLSGRVVKGTAPVAKTTVTVDGLPLATTADDGSFTIAHAPRKWELAAATSGELAAAQAHANGAVTLKLAPAATLTGTIRDGKTHQPLAGVQIDLTEPTGRRIMRMISGHGNAEASAITDAKGNFALTVRSGNYEIHGIHPAYTIAQTSIALPAGQHLSKTLAATPLAQVSGIVNDDAGRPVAAAGISVSQASRRGRVFFVAGPGRMPGATPEAFSGTDGHFSIRTNQQGELEVTATKKGLPNGTSSAFKVATGERKSGVTVTIPRGVSLAGRVIDHDGRPVSGVAVTAVNADEGPGGRRGNAMMRRVIINVAAGADADPVMTAKDGTFSDRVKPGSYDVHFSHEGYASKLVRADDVNASAKPLEVTLDPGVEISGRVTRGGAGVEGVTVAAIEADARVMTTTLSDGSFTLSDLSPGSYMVILGKPDEFIQQTRNISAPARNVVVDLPAGGRITGHVVDKSTHEAVTAFEAGLSFSRSGAGIAIAMPPQMKNFTADDGSFTLENVPPGPVQLVVSAPGYATARQSSISVEEGKTVADVQVELETGVRLVGHVTGPDGAPVAGVNVRPSGGGAMRIPGLGDSNTVTDANGDYALDSLEAGDNKTISFMAQGLLPAERTVNLTGREVHLDVQLSGGLTITGQVVTDSGAPVPDADVRAMSAAVGATPKNGQTDASGTFTFDSMAPGHYNFNASKDGFTNGQLTDFNVAAGAAPRIVLKSGGVLFGHVSGVADSDLQKVTVNVRSANGATEATLDSGGNYRVEGAPVGTLRVSAMLQRGFNDTQTTDVKSIELEAGGSAQLDLQFTANTVISGRITRNGMPAANSTVNFSPKNGTIQTRANAPTDQNGNYTVTGLSDGDYDVRVIDMQRVNAYETSYSVHGSGNFDITISTYTVRGHVVDRGDSSPIGGARVQLRPTNVQSLFSGTTAMSDDSGNFLLDGVAPGAYTVSADKDGYGNVVKDLTVGDSTPQDVMLDLARNDGITLRVVDGRDGTTLNANVALYDAQNRVVYNNTMRFGFGGGSDSDRIPVAAGQYRAIIGANGYAPKSVTLMSPSTQTISLTPGGSIMLHSKSAAPLRVVLVDSNGTPYVRPYSSDPAMVVPIGDTRLPNVAPGQYTLQVMGVDGSGGSSQTVVVVEGQEAIVNVG